jgi:FtsZ-interacting cell division protein ZipA
MWYNVALFVFMIVFLIAMLVSGHFGNNKKRRHDFYQEKIRDKLQEIRDQEAREAQKREQEMKLSKAKGTTTKRGEETKRGETHNSDDELDNSALLQKNNRICYEECQCTRS